MPDTNKKILVVEDEKALSKALQLKMSGEGFDVHLASNGKEALDLSKSEKFDLITLDLVMPIMDGFSFLEEFRKTNKETPVIILSNLSQVDDEKKAMELGANGFFVKSNMPISEVVKNIKSKLA